MDGLMPMPPMTRSVLSRPSTSCRLSFSGLPLMETAEVWRRSSGRLPLIVALAAPSLAPGVNCTILMMFRPTIGAFWTVSAVSLADRAEVEPDVDAGSVAGAQRDRGGLALEACELCLYLVNTNGQQRKCV